MKPLPMCIRDRNIDNIFNRSTTESKQYKILKYISINPGKHAYQINEDALNISPMRVGQLHTMYSRMVYAGMLTSSSSKGYIITPKGEAILRLVEDSYAV